MQLDSSGLLILQDGTVLDELKKRAKVIEGMGMGATKKLVEENAHAPPHSRPRPHLSTPAQTLARTCAPPHPHTLHTSPHARTDSHPPRLAPTPVLTRPDPRARV